MFTNRVTILFISLCCFYLWSLNVTPYPYQFAAKSLPIIILLLSVTITLQGMPRMLFGCALVASALGDIFLALTFENSFIFGLGAFLIAQLIYAISFYRFSSKLNRSLTAKFLVALLTIYGVLMAAYILPLTGDLLAPVAIYLFVILGMAVMAQLSDLPVSLKVGALLFVTSDSILALSLFSSPLPFSNVLVMLTYYLAQGLIVKGAIDKLSPGK